ncbi:hypothetical protein [Vitiosangium sp. GDMCC 1.1324]|uniref:hypothetical protein n=1 Tax=Vitiosangium sp. (strain GDMCC 1.1324) TaxID=2138576 RepID=UPI000D3AD382|nr:hypothetical protein [Vitiosangium sp. GDMCC 1.1324]PTL85911.1 hypothetical protein DAT35_04270 [Vitiosangium sp. GDMCC 1.1324]
MEKAIQTFEGLIRRSLAPSVTFFVILALGDLIRAVLNGESAQTQVMCYFGFLKSLESSPGLFVPIAILVVIGISNGLYATQQMLFDNCLKKNFDPPKWPRFSDSVKSEARALTDLRTRVTQRLNTEPDLVRLWSLDEPTDYILYEILGGIDPTDTRSFVDSAKMMGIVFVSIILVLLGHAVTLVAHAVLAWDWPHWCTWVAILLLLLAARLFYWWGREATRSQYRARAFRLYVNFLAMPLERIRRRLLRPAEDTPPAPQGK